MGEVNGRRRSRLKTGYANQLRLESGRGLRRTLYASQHRVHCPDVSLGHAS